jgi:subtilisin family serine protease
MHSHSRIVYALLFALASFIECRAQTDQSAERRIEQDVEQRGEARVIVQVRPQSSANASAASYLGAVLAGTGAAVTAIDQRTAVIRADRAALERLKADALTAYVRDEPIPLALKASVPLLGAPEVWSAGPDGKGVAIAILDTGIPDPNHPFLQGKVIMQACFSVEDPTAGAKSLCPSGGAPPLADGSKIDFTPNAATGCPLNIEGCEHGTHVAGIAAGKEVQDGSEKIAGVAKGADIVAIQVFSRFDRAADCFPAPAPCVLSFTSSQLRALQYVHSKVLNREATGEGARIVAINMSLGGGRNGAPCDKGQNSSYARRIQELRDDGVATFVAAGNDGFVDGVSFPGCISSAITIGAVEKKPSKPGEKIVPIADGDKLKLADFSNRFEDRLVSLVTFGVNIRSSIPGPGDKFAELSGTSMATPHAAGAYAALAAAFPAAGVNDIVSALKSTGVAVEEPISKKTLPAIQLVKAYSSLKAKLEAPASATPASANTASAAAAPPKAATGANQSESSTRFVVDIPQGRARESAVAIERSANELAKSLNTSGVKVAPIGTDTLSLTTESPVDRGALENALRGASMQVGRIYVDRAFPRAR